MTRDGLRQVNNADGMTLPTTFANRGARAVQSAPGKGRCVYFVVDDSFAGDA